VKYLKTQTKQYIYKNPEINTTIRLQNNNYALKILKLADNDDKKSQNITAKNRWLVMLFHSETYRKLENAS